MIQQKKQRSTKKPTEAPTQLLSDSISFKPRSFPDVQTIITALQSSEFQTLPLRKKFKKINLALFTLIKEAPEDVFLFSDVLDFYQRLNQAKIFSESLQFSSFEFWLNNFSEVSDEENDHIRAKIVGKRIPRSDYQAFFPIGMGRVYPGTHFVAAHLSPDVDTMIASFWGWMDAFAARIGTGLHLWCLPGGPPDSPVTRLFADMLGVGLFHSTSRTTQTLSLTAMDMLTQKKLVKESGATLTSDIDHGTNENAIILVNEQGHYLGDWRSSDAETVRHINILFKSCLRWFENNLHTKLITLFAQNNLSIIDLPQFYSDVFDSVIQECEPALEFNQKQKTDLDSFFIKLLYIENGLMGTFRDLIRALERLGISDLTRFKETIESLSESGLFDAKGHLKEDRPKIFLYLKKIISDLDQAIHDVRNYVERLDMELGIKHFVLEIPQTYVSLNSDVEEIRQKMQNYDFLTVVVPEQDGSLFPVGIVRASDLRRSCLGTVTLRDFSNHEEVKMASYLEVVSVVDHHKSSFRSFSAPCVLIGDVQSTNVLVAEQAFIINDRYSLGGMTRESIQDQIKAIGMPTTQSEKRILKRLISRSLASMDTRNFFIHPKREFYEYLSYVHAILDDTDLLTKVTDRDMECIASLLNRLKSLSLKKEVEIIHFDDIPRDQNFARTAAQRILRQDDMYSLYQQIYSFRELEVESNLSSCIGGKYSNIFLDAKEQNGCARVGQTKLFASNFPFFLSHVHEVRAIWCEKSKEVFKDHPEIDLHIHMISTIASAEEVYNNQAGDYLHFDELWLWAPPHQQGYNHLRSFLSGFQNALKNIKESLFLEFLGPHAQELQAIFMQLFPEVPQVISSEAQDGLSIAVLRFQAGLLNSRKSMITPYLPRLIT